MLLPNSRPVLQACDYQTEKTFTFTYNILPLYLSNRHWFAEKTAIFIDTTEAFMYAILVLYVSFPSKRKTPWWSSDWSLTIHNSELNLFRVIK